MGECPIWNTEAQISRRGDVISVDSQRTGGSYKLAGSAEPQIEFLTAEQRGILTTWIVDQRRSGDIDPLITTYALNDVLQRKSLPYSQKRRRLFLLLSEWKFKPNDSMPNMRSNGPRARECRETVSAWIESLNDLETIAFLRLMEQEDLFESLPSGDLRLSPKGFEYLEEIETGGAPTRQAFVAMWFNEATDAAYNEGIAPAIVDSGYTPFRVDRKETVNKIDDEIIAEIRRSRFMVADFTCETFRHEGKVRAEARGGVYFEAGFALGLGTDVIWTARKDCIDLVHFDTRQFAHILWETPDELRTKLKNRIGAVIR
jgi:hypothetical protein